MQKTLQELAHVVGGNLQGDGSLLIEGVTNLDDAGVRQITFAVPPHLEQAIHSSAGAVIIPPEAAMNFPKPAIVVENPRVAFTTLLELFTPKLVIEPGIHSSAVIGKNVSVGKNAAILPHVVIADDVVIGDNAIVYPHVYIGQGVTIGHSALIYPSVTIREFCQIGHDVIIHANTVIGSDGFGFVTVKGKHEKVPQVGNVVVGNNVEIGANVGIDRATTGSTVVKDGTKIDNLVHLAHNVVIGQDCFLCAQVGIAGSTQVGNHVIFAGQSGCNGHITIGDNCIFAARSAPIKDVPSGSFQAGFPARSHRDWLKVEAALPKVPDLLKKVKQLEKQLHDLENKLS
jgi:UDP-3-O-[3-hydroxymyristoyl] glucosamine N-acyltransferase